MKKYLIPIASAILTAASAQADIVLSDSFTYPNGPIVGATASPWNSHSGTAGSSVVNNNQLRISTSSTEDVNALLSGGPYLSNSAAVLYSSFKVNFSLLPTATGAYFAHFKDTNVGAPSGFGARIWASTAGAAAGTFRLGIGNGSQTDATSGQIATDLSLSTTYIVVSRFVPNTGLATIWLNPSAESDPSVTATDVGTTRPNPIDVVAYAFRQASGEGTMLVDDLKVGTAFSDVAGPNNPPSITGVANQHLAVGMATPVLPFTVNDTETPANSLVVTAGSSNQGLVPNANIVLGGSGSSRTVQVTPAGGQQGTATITLSVSDGAITANTSFQVAVGIPSISDIPNQSTPVNTVLSSITFTVGDTETPAGSLTVTATSGNQTLVPDANLTPGGSGASRTLSIMPAADQTGLVTITVTVSDGTSSASDNFLLAVNPLLGLLRSDDFNRPDGSLVTGNGEWVSNGGTGGTHIGELQIGGGKAAVTENGSEDVSTEMPVSSGATYPPSSGTILYYSMKVALTNLPSPGGSYFAHLKSDAFDGQNFRARVYSATSGAASGKYRLGIANNAASITAEGLFPSDLSLNTAYFVVVRYNIGTGESRFWVNPTSESSPGINAVDAPNVITIGAFTLRQNAGMGGVLVDDLKIGTAFTDVIEAGPVLTITAVGSNVTLSWPTAPGYVLRYTDSFPASWADFSDQGAPQGPLTVVTVNEVSGSRFFELRKP